MSRPGFREHYFWDPDHACAHAYVSFYVDESGPLGASEGWPLIRDLSDPLAALCRYLLWLGGTDTTAARGAYASTCWAGSSTCSSTGPARPTRQTTCCPNTSCGSSTTCARPGARAGAGAAASKRWPSAARVSPGHLARMFRQTFGLGPVGAVELIRLARAAILLQRSNLSVGAVSEVVGFANPFHFSRRFRAAYGTAPRTYRTARPQDPLDPVRRAGLLALAQRLLVEDL